MLIIAQRLHMGNTKLLQQRGELAHQCRPRGLAWIQLSIQAFTSGRSCKPADLEPAVFNPRAAARQPPPAGDRDSPVISLTPTRRRRPQTAPPQTRGTRRRRPRTPRACRAAQSGAAPSRAACQPAARTRAPRPRARPLSPAASAVAAAVSGGGGQQRRRSAVAAVSGGRAAGAQRRTRSRKRCVARPPRRSNTNTTQPCDPLQTAAHLAAAPGEGKDLQELARCAREPKARRDLCHIHPWRRGRGSGVTELWQHTPYYTTYATYTPGEGKGAVV